MSFNIQTEQGEVLVTNENFADYFFDVRINKPKPGQVLAKFKAVAEFVSGQGKKDIIYLLKIGKVQQAFMVMRKIHGAREEDCYKLLTDICEDLLEMPDEEVENMVYEFVIELFFYTQKEYVPKSPNWETIQILEYDKETGEYKSRIEI